MVTFLKVSLEVTPTFAIRPGSQSKVTHITAEDTLIVEAFIRWRKRC